MSKVFTLSEVQLNNGQNGKPCWIIIKESVYDVTKFLNEHPGGRDTLLEYGGKNATKEFNVIGHSSEAIADMQQYKIGFLKNELPAVTSHKHPEKSEEKLQRKRQHFFFCC